MKHPRSNIELYKELKELWNWLEFCVWTSCWRKASETCNKINKLKRA